MEYLVHAAWHGAGTGSSQASQAIVEQQGMTKQTTLVHKERGGKGGKEGREPTE